MSHRDRITIKVNSRTSMPDLGCRSNIDEFALIWRARKFAKKI